MNIVPAGLMGVGLDWCHQVYVQEYWHRGTRHYALANGSEAEVRLTIHEWEEGRVALRLAGPWKLWPDEVTCVDAEGIAGQPLVGVLNGGAFLGLLSPSAAPGPAWAGKVVTVRGLNGSGIGEAALCVQNAPTFPSGGVIELEMLLSLEGATLTFERSKALSAVTEATFLGAESDTLRVEEGEEQVGVSLTSPERAKVPHVLRARFKAPTVSRLTLAVVSGRYAQAKASSALTRGVVVAP